MADEQERGRAPGEAPPLVAAAASWPGRVLILAAAALLFPPPHRLVLSVLLLAFMLMPARHDRAETRLRRQLRFQDGLP